MELITKLRGITSAGLMDCKKALAETNGDIEAAIEILRKKGQAVAAKREDRNAAEGCALAKNEGAFACIVALNCETDFVAKNEGFVTLTQQILDAAMANKPTTLEALNAITIDGRTIADLVVEKGGQTGEKTEIGAFEVVEAASTSAYTHFNKKLAAIVGFSMPGVDKEVGQYVAMQVASMNPVAVDRKSVPQATIDSELSIAVEKTKRELVQKAVDFALSKAGLNPHHFDSDDHIASNTAKGWITEEQAAQGREIIATVSEAEGAKLPQAKIDAIANGRLNKFFKEMTLMEQEFINDPKMNIGQYLDKAQKGLVAVGFKRVNLNAD